MAKLAEQVSILCWAGLAPSAQLDANSAGPVAAVVVSAAALEHFQDAMLIFLFVITRPSATTRFVLPCYELSVETVLTRHPCHLPSCLSPNAVSCRLSVNLSLSCRLPICHTRLAAPTDGSADEEHRFGESSRLQFYASAQETTAGLQYDEPGLTRLPPC